MKTCRIHITGASGAGVTTLGRALANAAALPHHDTDDYFWQPTTPPYRDEREPAVRLRLMGEMFLDRPAWVLTGSLNGWGDPVIPFFDLVVFLRADRDVRLQRLRAREALRYGAEAVAPGGPRHESTEEFVEWASHYDDGTRKGRSLIQHEAWLAALPCPILRLDGARPVADLTGEVMTYLADHR
jgi:adenylate kinase family enzyme